MPNFSLPVRNILAFDTSTEVMSIAVQGGASIYEFTGAGAAQASARLIPEIQALMRQAALDFKQLDCIAFGAGPGAFTGLRAACAVAQGLGFAANVPLLPIGTLHAVALQRRRSTGDLRVIAALDARMDEIYWQEVDFQTDPLGTPVGEPALAKAHAQSFVLGTSPTARVLIDLAQHMLAQGLQVQAANALPLYVRNKVAQTTAERSAPQT